MKTNSLNFENGLSGLNISGVLNSERRFSNSLISYKVRKGAANNDQRLQKMKYSLKGWDFYAEKV